MNEYLEQARREMPPNVYAQEFDGEFVEAEWSADEIDSYYRRKAAEARAARDDRAFEFWNKLIRPI